MHPEQISWRAIPGNQKGSPLGGGCWAESKGFWPKGTMHYLQDLSGVSREMCEPLEC